MIKEFALEPDVLATSFRDFSYFIEKFGVAQGRVISRFPKDWKRMVYEAAQASLRGTRELSRIEVRLKEIKDDVLIESRRPGGDGTQPWLTRALAEHARLPFSGIIAREHKHQFMLAAIERSHARVVFDPWDQLTQRAKHWLCRIEHFADMSPVHEVVVDCPIAGILMGQFESGIEEFSELS